MQLSRWDGLPQAAQDVARKFNNTFVLAQVPEIDRVTRVYHFRELHARDSRVEVRGNDGVRAYYVNWKTIDVLQEFPEHTGAVPFQNTVILFKRKPARQWQVGMCDGNTFIWNRTGHLQRLNLNYAEACYQPQYQNRKLEEVVKELSAKDSTLEAYAINSTYWLSGDGSRVVLYRNRIPLGTFLYGSFLLNKACSSLSQELWDDLKIKV